MQEVIPKVVAMAVSMVMMMWSILLQVFLFSMMFVFFCFFYHRGHGVSQSFYFTIRTENLKELRGTQCTPW